MGKLRVMLVEDHPIFRDGLRRALEAEADIDVVGEFGDGKQALEQAEQLQPDVVITDINLPGMNGIQLSRALKSANLDIAIIVLSAYDDDEQIFHAMRVGAAAFFPKDVNPRRLMEAIRQVAQGNYVVEDDVLEKPEVATWILKHFEQVAYVDGVPNEVFGPLSPREMEILEHITMGRSNKEVAQYLGISGQTVNNHMTSILRKLSVNDRTQAAMYAVRRGWIRLDETDELR